MSEDTGDFDPGEFVRECGRAAKRDAKDTAIKAACRRYPGISPDVIANIVAHALAAAPALRAGKRRGR